MDDCFQVKEETIEFKDVKENFLEIAANDTGIKIIEEQLETHSSINRTGSIK